MLTQAELKALLHYDPATGIFTWKERDAALFRSSQAMQSWNERWAGKQAGCSAAGRIDVHVLKTNWRGHRLAFLYMTGSVPPLVDHRDGNPLNNSFSNLRAASNGQNRSNSKPTMMRKLKGVYARSTGNYQALIRFENKTIGLGTFADPMAAARAYDAAAVLLHGKFARTNLQLGLLT
jgi:hypothetical protein